MRILPVLAACFLISGCATGRPSGRTEGPPPERRSDVIQAVAYDSATRDLTLSFHNGDIFIYHQVPARIYEGLMKAPLKGGYYRGLIQDRYRRTVEATSQPDPPPAEEEGGGEEATGDADGST